MSQSSLVTDTVWADPSNFSAFREEPIHGVVVHHTATTNLSSVTGRFSTPGAGASAHYVVAGKKIIQCVKEEYTAWALGDWLGNSGTVSIEVLNSNTGGDWPVSDDSKNTCIKLIADIAKRNNLGKLWLNPDATWPTLSGHRDYVATACPGDYQYTRLQEYADKANQINEDKPKKAELKWSKLSKVVQYQAKKDCYLYDFNHTKANDCKKVKDFAKNTVVEIYGTCENKTIGKTYLVTEYSYTRKITNGFLESDWTKYEAPKPADNDDATEIIIPADGASGEVENNPRGLTDAEYKKIKDRIEAVGENAKKEGVMIPMSNKVYDVLKIVAIIVLPLISAVYVGLSKIWGFGFGTEIDQTIQIIIAAINVVLGAALVKSSADYHKGDA